MIAHGKKLDGKIALITGASRGIGAETARVLRDHGAYVILTDILDEEGSELARLINGMYLHLDVGDADSWSQVYDDIKSKFGKLDVLFNNAGITGFDSDYGSLDPEYSTLESWRDIHRVNLDSVFLGCKYAIKLMKENGGSIINMSSHSGLVGIPGAAAYASSKAAIRNHTKTVALYCAQNKYNIRCNSVHLGAILTPIWDAMLGDGDNQRKEMLKSVEAGIPLGHMGDPVDVANMVLFLASSE